MKQENRYRKNLLKTGVLFLCKQSFTLLLLLAFGVALPLTQARADAIDDYIRAEMARQKIPGLSLAVVRSGKVVRAQGYGMANIELSVPATADTVYQLGSVGKQFTAGAVLLMMEDGKIGLDDSLSKYLDFAPDEWKAVTVRHLLTHTSGLKDYTGLIDLSRDATAEETARKLIAKPLDFTPGAKWAYSNTNYLLLGIVIGKASGTFYGDTLKKRVFTPLGMTTARVNSDTDIIPHRAAGYEPLPKGGGWRNQSYVPPTINTYADGSLVMSVRDMAKWAVALDTDVPFKQNLRKEMWTPVTLAEGKTHPYGFGWAIGSQNGHSVIGHAGAWQGFTANISRYPDDKLCVIVLTNVAGADPVRITREIAGKIVPALKPAPIVDQNEQEATVLVQTVIRQITAAQLDKNLFAPEMWEIVKEYATPDRAKQIKQLGGLKKATLLAQQKDGQERVYQYRLQFARASLRCLLTLDAQKKIAGLLLSAGG